MPVDAIGSHWRGNCLKQLADLPVKLRLILYKLSSFDNHLEDPKCF